MRPGQKRVMDAFLLGKKKTESAMSTDGTSVSSYGLKIAYRTRTGRILYLLPPSHGGPAFSSSTSAHLGACAACETQEKVKAFKSAEALRTAVEKDREKVRSMHSRSGQVRCKVCAPLRCRLAP